jgi:hypothetical protein
MVDPENRVNYLDNAAIACTVRSYQTGLLYASNRRLITIHCHGMSRQLQAIGGRFATLESSLVELQ